MKVIRRLAALFIFTSLILPSIAYADEKTTVEVDAEKNVELNRETENLLEEAPIVERKMMSAKKSIVESKTSLLGDLKGSKVRIYKDLNKQSNYV